MYFADLTPYRYLHVCAVGAEDSMVCRFYPQAANVGWLDGKHIFPKSDSPLDPEVLDALFAHCLHPIHETLGHHTCESCPSWFHRLFGISTWGKRFVGHRNGRRAYLDNGEVLVVSRTGRAFIAPMMIFHYVIKHRYLPPEPFLSALLESDPEGGEKLEAAGEEESLNDLLTDQPGISCALAYSQIIGTLIARQLHARR